MSAMPQARPSDDGPRSTRIAVGTARRGRPARELYVRREKPRDRARRFVPSLVVAAEGEGGPAPLRWAERANVFEIDFDSRRRDVARRALLGGL